MGENRKTADSVPLNPLFPSNHFGRGKLTIFTSESRHFFKREKSFMESIQIFG